MLSYGVFRCIPVAPRTRLKNKLQDVIFSQITDDGPSMDNINHEIQGFSIDYADKPTMRCNQKVKSTNG